MDPSGHCGAAAGYRCARWSANRAARSSPVARTAASRAQRRRRATGRLYGAGTMGKQLRGHHGLGDILSLSGLEFLKS